VAEGSFAVTVDANRLLTFCRAVEETSDAGLLLFSRDDLIATTEELEALKIDVERALMRLAQLTASEVQ
jgi:hypothetical protein